MEAQDALNLAGHALRQILECISFQAATCEKYVNTLCIRRGFSSLPDEILSDVLEYAAYTHGINRHEEQAAIQTVKAATKLSHTCQRFRQLVVRIPSLWNRIFNTMPPQMISACYDRLTIANAEVFLCNRSQSVVQFVRTATNHSSYWHRYDHYTDVYSIDEILELAEATLNLDAPSLSETHYSTFLTAQWVS